VTTFHEQSVNKSRKRRRCKWCAEIIDEGQPYESYRFADGGDVGHMIYHPECMVAQQEMARREKWEFEWSPGDFKRGSIDER
jgi:hypothetical protein